MLAAAHAAQCDDILAKLPQGLDTVVGAHGVYLSGGSSSASPWPGPILKDAPIVVLDEATAFADPENEHQIQKAFEALTRKKTVLMIAHRLSTVQDADNILVLNEGKIAEQGSHSALLEKNGVYAAMWGGLSAQRPVEGRKGGSGMIKKLQHWFALSEKGAKDFVKAVGWCFVCNLALLFPVGRSIHGPAPAELPGGRRQPHGRVLALCGLCFGGAHPAVSPPLVPVRVPLYRHLPGERQPPGEPGETLRRLPLSFFGNRDLSDLTSTMIADCSSLDQMFSHYVPQLFASIGSTLAIGACMFVCDWRMALAVLWVVPVAVALTAGSKKIQDTFGTKNILNKRAVSDCIQEGAGDDPGHQGLPPAGAVSRRSGGETGRDGS